MNNTSVYCGVIVVFLLWCFWYLIKKCETRANLLRGNRWCGGRSRTHLLWWTTGSPPDSCLTLEIERRTVRLVFERCIVLLMPSRAHEFRLFFFFLPDQHGRICARWKLQRLLYETYIRKNISLTQVISCYVLSSLMQRWAACRRMFWMCVSSPMLPPSVVKRKQTQIVNLQSSTEVSFTGQTCFSL